jgi:hypothetical protein
MKTKTLSQRVDIPTAMALLMLAGTIGSGKAQDLPVKLNITMVAASQAQSTYADLITMTRCTSKDILSLASARLGTTFPKGSTLALADIFTETNQTPIAQLNTPVIVGPKGDIITNVSGIFKINSPTNYLTRDRSWSNGPFYTMATVTMAFDDGGGNSFQLNGLSTRTYAVSPNIRLDSQFHGKGHERFTVILKGAGEGKLLGKFAVFAGTISGSAQGVYSDYGLRYNPGLSWFSGGAAGW